MKRLPRSMQAILAILMVFAVGTRDARAQQHEHAPSPYAGQEARDIKALDPDRVAGLLAGDGLGYAKAAELNGVAGPKHVLELATELGLTDDQRAATETIFEGMREGAVELGRRIVEAERRLDRAFAAGELDARTLRDHTAEIGRLEGELRAVHLAAHLEMMDVLTRYQVHEYMRLRGYEEEAGHGA